jgi:hypothetical protein
MIGEKVKEEKSRSIRHFWDDSKSPEHKVKGHRKYVNMYSIECRTGEESSGSSVLDRGRRDKAGGSIKNENGLV